MKRKPRYVIKPKMLPLILMTLGTILLAIPTTVLMLDTFDLHSRPDMSNENAITILLLTSSGAFILFGYIWTLISRRFNVFFWLFSALYNFGLTSIYLYFFITSAPSSTEPSDLKILYAVMLFLTWMVFMTAGSIYYTYRAFLHRSMRLP